MRSKNISHFIAIFCTSETELPPIQQKYISKANFKQMVLKDHSYLWSASKSPFIKYCWDKNNKDNDLDDHVSPLYKELLPGNFF